LKLGLTGCSPEDDVMLNLANIDGKISIIGADGTLRHKYKIEIAENAEDMYHGLMVVPGDVEVAMWMKDTLIPLDMVFADEKGEIFYIHENAKPNDLTPIYPPKRPRVVLEINGGQSQKNNIKIGDVISTK